MAHKYHENLNVKIVEVWYHAWKPIEKMWYVSKLMWQKKWGNRQWEDYDGLSVEMKRIYQEIEFEELLGSD